jgi:Arc/MetJ-type ribon-helix-helix transcriptional regulator
MVRAHVQFTEEQLAALREIASREGVSVSHVVRQSVDLLLRERRERSREELVKRSLQAVGLFRSGTGDLAATHDQYFAEAGEQGFECIPEG